MVKLTRSSKLEAVAIGDNSHNSRISSIPVLLISVVIENSRDDDHLPTVNVHNG